MTTTLYRTRFAGPLGPLELVACDEGLAGVFFEDHRHAGAYVARDEATHPMLVRASDELEEYFGGCRTRFETPLAANRLRNGTAFQRSVWAALSTIPYGTTWNYGDLARAIGRPSAMRAVGAANGLNPLSIFVPCHRVIGAGGGLTGYAGGIAWKRWLLAHEILDSSAAPGASAFDARSATSDRTRTRSP